MILRISRSNITHGVMQGWKTQFRRAKAAKCVFPTCDFVSESENALIKHHSECPNGDVQLFQCSQCKFQSDNKEAVIRHIKLKHVTMKQKFDPSDSDGKFKRIKNLIRKTNFVLLLK